MFIFISSLYSAEQLINRQKTTAMKRHRNQNAEIDELAQLLPVKLMPVVSQSIGGVLDFDGLGTSDKTLPIDKISCHSYCVCFSEVTGVC